MIRGCGMMERFITNGRYGVAKALTYKYIVDASGSPFIRAWLREDGKPLLLDVYQVALQADLLKKRVVIAYVLIEVSHQNNVMTSRLVSCDECDQVFTKVVTRIQVRAVFLEEGGALLIIGSNANFVGWFLADLIGSNENVDTALCAGHGDVRPTTVLITVMELNVAGDITLCDDDSTAGLIICESLVFATT
jgi:hypothetical protein